MLRLSLPRSGGVDQCAVTTKLLSDALNKPSLSLSLSLSLFLRAGHTSPVKSLKPVSASRCLRSHICIVDINLSQLSHILEPTYIVWRIGQLM